MLEKISIDGLLKKLLGNASFYGIGTLFVKAGSLILIPIYWSRLEAQHFGIIGISQILPMFLAPVLSMGLSESLQRLYFDWPEKLRSKCFGTLWLTGFSVGLIICLILSFYGENLSKHIFTKVDFDPYIKISIWICFFLSLNSFHLNFLRVTEQLKSFTLISIFSFIIQSVVTLTLIFYFNYKAMGILWGIFSAQLFLLIFGIIVSWSFFNISFEFKPLKESLKYALGILPAVVFEGFNNVLDRYFLDKFLNLSKIGIYTLGQQFGSAYNIFNQILKSAWVPLIFRITAEHSKAREALGVLSGYYMLILLIPCLLIILFSREVIHLINKPEYLEVGSLVPLFVSAYFINSFATAYGRGIDLSKKTIWAPIVPVIGIASSIVFLYYLVPMYGIYGAISALIFTNIIRVLVQILLAYLCYPRPVYWKPIFSILLCFLFSLIIAYSFSDVDVRVFSLKVAFYLLIVFSIFLFLKKESKKGSAKSLFKID